MNNEELSRFHGADACTTDGDKLGSVGHVYLDDRTGEPTWVTVSTGLFGTGETLVPVEGSRWDSDRLVLAYDKATIKDAPRVDVDAHISPAEEQELFSYYRGHGYDYDAQLSARGDRDRVEGVADVSNRDAEGRMTAAEERLRVGTETVEAGRARLRKYTTTEEQTVTVPVTKEKLVVERTPVEGRSNGTIDADAADVVEEVTLREERPVVSKETVDVEEVRLGKVADTEERTVTEQVSKEHIEVEGDGGVDEGTHPRR